MSEEPIELTACPKCGAPAQYIAAMPMDNTPRYRYAPSFPSMDAEAAERAAKALYAIHQCTPWTLTTLEHRQYYRQQIGVVLDALRMTPAADPRPTIAELQAQVKSWTVEKGWADDRSVGDLLMLMVSELAEALEEYRDWHEPFAVRVRAGKPEGIPIELADVVIRILSFAAKYGFDLEDAVLQKMEYNETRPHRHGGRRL